MLLTIPLYDLVVVPLAVRMGRPITMISRIGMGFFLCMLALLSGEADGRERRRGSCVMRSVPARPRASPTRPFPAPPPTRQPG